MDRPQFKDKQGLFSDKKKLPLFIRKNKKLRLVIQ